MAAIQLEVIVYQAAGELEEEFQRLYPRFRGQAVQRRQGLRSTMSPYTRAGNNRFESIRIDSVGESIRIDSAERIEFPSSSIRMAVY